MFITKNYSTASNIRIEKTDSYLNEWKMEYEILIKRVIMAKNVINPNPFRPNFMYPIIIIFGKSVKKQNISTGYLKIVR